MGDPQAQKIYVMDFGGQYTQLIAKAVRQCNVFSEIVPHNQGIEKILGGNPKGIILSGGPDSVYAEGAPLVDSAIFGQGIPILGICYGMQQTNFLLGGKILHGDRNIREYGETRTSLDVQNSLFQGLDDNITAWMSHGDSVDPKNLADGFKIIATTKNHVAAMANDRSRIYGVQFHPEVTHTQHGKGIIANFVHSICGCDYSWNMGSYIEQAKRYVQETVGNNDVLCFVSGGVDSSFVAKLINDTPGIGNKYFVYIGALMRKHENEEVVKSLKDAGIKNLIFKDYEQRFIDAVAALGDPNDPEKKRKTIGNLFGAIMEETCEGLNIDPKNTFLAQGTLYTDLIESGKGVGKKAATIKSHHNVGCKFIEELKAEGRIVEPNREIFKDEVREAAREIGLPSQIYARQPYPGPGLGIRIVNARSEWAYYLHEISGKVDKFAKEAGMKLGYAMPVKTVGVQGDERTYSFLAGLRGPRDWEKIRDAARLIPQNVKEVNRIVYEVSGHRGIPDIRNIIGTPISRETVDQLKDVDFIGREIIDEYNFSDKISQTILVLFGADPYQTGKRSAALRGVSTDDFMTVTPIEPVSDLRELINMIGKKTTRMTWTCLDEICRDLTKKGKVGSFFIDVTDKPPATTCWE